MISATRRLIARMTAEPDMDWTEFQAYTDLITQHGGIEDARGLLGLLKSSELRPIHSELLWPIMAHGDVRMAEELYIWGMEKGRLREDAPYEVLHALGYMGFEPCTAELVRLIPTNNWYVTQASCLGLIHLPCERYQAELEAMLNRSFGEAVFEEFLPVLSCKIADRSIVPKLVEWGKRSASIDCNAGLIFGIALFGPEEKETIRQILWDPGWEAHGRSTGTAYWSYMAMQQVGLLFTELIEDVKRSAAGVLQHGSRQELEYRLEVLLVLLTLKLETRDKPVRFMTTNPESVRQIHDALFRPKRLDEDSSVTSLISRLLPEEESLLRAYEHLQDKMNLSIRHEIETEYWTDKERNHS